MKIGYVQFQPLLGNVKQNIQTIAGLVTDADADLLVLPELCTTGYHFVSRQEVVELAEEIPEGHTTWQLERLCQKKNIWLVAGLIEKHGRKVYNSAILVGPDGYQGTYRKVHLFNEETLWFDYGDKGLPVFDIGKCRIGLMICFDWLFPEAARTLAIKGADIICHPANLVLPYCQDAMVTRCLENRVFSVTANRIGSESRGQKNLKFTGKSQIVAPNGAILLRAGRSSQETGVTNIDISQARDKKINPYNDILASRRPECYVDLISRINT